MRPFGYEVVHAPDVAEVAFLCENELIVGAVAEELEELKRRGEDDARRLAAAAVAFIFVDDYVVEMCAGQKDNQLSSSARQAGQHKQGSRARIPSYQTRDHKPRRTMQIPLRARLLRQLWRRSLSLDFRLLSQPLINSLLPDFQSSEEVYAIGPATEDEEGEEEKDEEDGVWVDEGD